MQDIECLIPMTTEEKTLVAALATAKGYDNPEDYMREVIASGIAELSRALGIKPEAPSVRVPH